MDEKNIFLAFDFGTRNIGVAVGQKITKSATALTPLLAEKGIPRWEEIDSLIKNWQPLALVVGVPYKFDGSDLKVTKLAKRFIEQLKKRYQLEVYAAEERLTTKAAREEIFARGGYRALQNESVDSVAAKIILEEWMA
ncbi:putative pre-16S rRNA nuclease [Gammaproteobacteria bacterium]